MLLELPCLQTAGAHSDVNLDHKVHSDQVKALQLWHNILLLLLHCEAIQDAKKDIVTHLKQCAWTNSRQE